MDCKNKLHEKHIMEILDSTLGRYSFMDYSVEMNDEDEDFTAFLVSVKGVVGDAETVEIRVVLQTDGENLCILQGEDFNDSEPMDIFPQLLFEALFKDIESC